MANHEDTFWIGVLRWDPPEIDGCVSSYRVMYTEDQTESGTRVPWQWNYADVTEPSYRPNLQLRRCTDYRFQIRAVSTDGVEGRPLTQVFRTSGCFTNPLPFQSAAASSTSGASSSLRRRGFVPTMMLGNEIFYFTFLLYGCGKFGFYSRLDGSTSKPETVSLKAKWLVEKSRV